MTYEVGQLVRIRVGEHTDRFANVPFQPTCNA